MIYSIGEMLIDLMQEGDSYVPHPGGAPANVAAHAKKSGADAVFVGKISTDVFGNKLYDNLLHYQIHYPLERSAKNTALAIVSHQNGDRQFQFYRNNTADLDLSVEDIDTIKFRSDDILHFCSLGLVAEGTTKQAHHHAIHQCRKQGGTVSFDVNLRERLWTSLDDAYRAIMELIPYAHIIKVNETELSWLTGSDDVPTAIQELQTDNQLVICTMGEKGSYVLKPDGTEFILQPDVVQQVDTTGAGDSYIAVVLASLSLSNLNLDDWIEKELIQAIKKASYVSAQVVQKKGAIPNVSYKYI